MYLTNRLWRQRFFNPHFFYGYLNSCALSFEIIFYWSSSIYQWSLIDFKKTCRWQKRKCSVYIYIYIGFISWDVLQSLFLSGDQKCLVNKDYNQTHECTSKTYIYTYILHYTCQNLKIMLNINAWLITITHSKTFPQWTSERRRKNKESKCCVLSIKIHSTQCKCSLSSFASCQREKEQCVCVYIHRLFATFSFTKE